MAIKNTVHVPLGYEIQLEADAISDGTYVRLGNPGGTQYNAAALAASESITLGPFNEPRDYAIFSVNGLIAHELVQSGVFSESDNAAKADLASPTFTGTVGLPATIEIDGVALAPTIAEINYLDGVTSAIQTQLDGKASDVVSTNVGTAATNVTAVESGDAYQHTVVLTVANAVLPAITGGADEAEGVLLYTLPAGAVVIKQAYMSLAIQQQDGNITADTPDGGLGTTIATGAVATLDTTPAFENILTGQTFDDCDGTAEVKTVADQVLVIEAADNHTVYFNVADQWAASGDTGALVSGTVVLHYQFMA